MPITQALFVEEESLKDKLVRVKKIWSRYTASQKVGIISFIVLALVKSLTGVIVKEKRDLR